MVSMVCQKVSPPGTGVPVAGTKLPSNPSISIVKWTGPSIEDSVSIQPLHEVPEDLCISQAKNVVMSSSLCILSYSCLENALIPT